MTATAVDRIESKPGFCGGRPCIVGHRIRVADIVNWHEFRGYCADEIVDMFPGLTLGDIHAALAYYFDHRPEIEADMRAEEEFAVGSASAPSKFREKLRGT